MGKPPRFTIVLLLAIILSMMGSACSSTAQPTEAPTSVDAAETAPTEAAPTESSEEAATEAPSTDASGIVTLRMGTWVDETESASLQAVIDQVNSQAVGYQIVLENNPVGYFDSLKTSLSEGTGPDLFWLEAEDMPDLANRDLLLNITSYIQADTTDAAAKLDDYFPMALKTARYHDKYFGLPWTAQPIVLYYNQALFDKAGLAYPDDTWDWNTLTQYSALMTLDTDRDGKKDQFGFIMNGFPPVSMFIWQAGGEMISDDLETCPIDSTQAIKGMTFYTDMIYDGVHTPEMSTFMETPYDDLINSGNVAIFMGLVSDTYTLPEGQTLGMASVPSGPSTRETYAEVYSTSISKATANPDLAYQALVAVTEALQTWKVAPPRQSLATAETISQIDPNKAADANTILAALQNMRTENIIPRQQDWNVIFLGEVIDKAIHSSVDNVVTSLARQERANLEEILPGH